jgi:hypothetical protein
MALAAYHAETEDRLRRAGRERVLTAALATRRASRKQFLREFAIWMLFSVFVGFVAWCGGVAYAHHLVREEQIAAEQSRNKQNEQLRLMIEKYYIAKNRTGEAKGTDSKGP